jgi:hypothetical protein
MKKRDSLECFFTVSDHFLTILTNGRVTTDRVGPHSDLLSEFPYFWTAAQGRCCPARGLQR